MNERFSDRLRRKFDPVWEAQHQHPFVRGLGAGTLDEARFLTWLRQHYLYLIEYVRLLSLAAARGREVDIMKWMIQMAHGVLHGQMLLHQAYAIEFGLTTEELEAGEKLPTTRAYTDHLLRTASLAAYLELAAAMLPCVWGYAEIGQRLARESPSGSRYARWLDTYSGPVAAGLVQAARDLLDRLALGAGPGRLVAAEEAFATSSRYEWMFWQMCWQGETWPV